MKWLWIVACVAVLCGGSYVLGRSHAETKIVKQQVEIIKYVAKKRAEIAAKPNANRDDLLKLMRDNKL